MLELLKHLLSSAVVDWKTCTLYDNEIGANSVKVSSYSIFYVTVILK